MTLRSCLAGSVVTLSVAATLLVGGAPAVAAPADPAPVLSGLEVRDYSGPIPARAGTLISARPLDGRVSLRGAARAYRILYATTNQFDRRAVSTGAVFIPRGAPPRDGWPIVAWAHGTVGMGDDCAPSVQARAADEADYLDHFLRRGYAVVATDYVGMGTPGLLSYLNGVTAAHSVADSVIAARALPAPLARRWAVVGHSQGAGAALSSARFAGAFTTGAGLDFRGVVATGTPANIESIVQFAGPTLPPIVLPRTVNGYALYILAGFRDARRDLPIDALLTPKGRRLVDIAEQACGRQIRPYAQNLDLRTLFTRPLDSIPGIYSALRRYLGTPDSGYTRPIFLGQGLLDVNVPAPSALSLAAQLTANRQPLELHVYPDADHSGVLSAARADIDRFISRALQ